jgi:transcriptional regulator with XRE-family HTH domain
MREIVTVADVMKVYMRSYKLTQQRFSEALNESLVGIDVSRVSVTNWCNGKSSPSTDFLLICAVAYEDWRRSWAMSCLKVKLPEVFDAGVITFNLSLSK